MLSLQIHRNNMTSYVVYLLVACFLGFSLSTRAQVSRNTEMPGSAFSVFRQLSTINPTPEVKALYQYLQSITGEKILTGQMYNSDVDNEKEYLYILTGKRPAICGIDLGLESANETQINNTIERYADGGIPLVTWNWQISPFNNNSTTIKPEIDIARCFQDGTTECEAFYKELDRIADHLEKLNNAGVPVLWNPFSDNNSSRFWWSTQSQEQLYKIWQTMFNYFTDDRQLNNLIWIQSFREVMNTGRFAGNKYVDMIRISSDDYTMALADNLFTNYPEKTNESATPIILISSTKIPPTEKLSMNGTLWCWWIPESETSVENTNETNFYSIFNDKKIVTRNAIPKLLNNFGEVGIKRLYSSGAILPFLNLKEYNLGTKSRKIINHDRLEVFVESKGKNDEYYFAFTQMDGDFDVSVQAINLSPEQVQAKAGIMVRTNLSKKSHYVFFHIKTGEFANNTNSEKLGLLFRNYKRKKPQLISTNPLKNEDILPNDSSNIWIRLQRRGNIFKSYFSHDNSNWQLCTVHEQKMPKFTLVGVAVSCRNTRESAQIEFKDMEFTWE
ncbi:glycosyl hydrolase [uncultured Draconibacterium sp.]|uniref:glycosyl hydrolase n=1 Tax=uncultured Draconibacterium sp. TaxID=1573823 RepID=UPI0029C96BBB|nr:glycosyl hydrolase [uncultured Draconibacterium sp.]